VKKYDITKCLTGLFEKAGLDYKQNLLKQLTSENFDGGLYKNLLHYLNLLLDIRNSVSETDIDYISCPGCSFHSDEKLAIVKNGDENGAYNIARKGIMVLEKIKQYKKRNGSLDQMNWGDLFIGIEEWDKFTQK
jgi:CRISPR-associated protein Cpf1